MQGWVVAGLRGPPQLRRGDACGTSTGPARRGACPEREEVPARTISAPGSQSVIEIAQRARPAIAQIRVEGKEGDASGSGVLIRSDGHVLTNFHVVDGADAVKVVLDNGRELSAKVLGIVLTRRGKHEGKDIPMCGVPIHSAESYIDRLLQQGFKVAIAEQLEEPSQAEGLVKRDIVHVITPGTVVSVACHYECCLPEREPDESKGPLGRGPRRGAV